MNLVSIRAKNGTVIRTYAVSGGFVYMHAGKVVHVTSEDIRLDPVAAECHFFTAWRDVTGFVPFTACRMFRGKLRPVSVLFSKGFQNMQVKTWPNGKAWARPIAA